MSAGPVAETFDFWPFDIPPGTEFLLVYAVIALVGVVLAKAVQVVLLGLLAPAGAEASRGGGYRAPARQQPKLAVGTYPSVDDTLAIAYLGRGESGLAEAIFVQATAEGWLRPGQTHGQVAIYPLPADASASSRRLAANLHATSASTPAIRAAAARVAQSLAPDLQRDLVELRLLHGAAERTYAFFAFAGIGAIVLGVGLIRIVRGLELGRSVGFLVAETFVIGLALALLSRPKKLTDKGEAYLKWIKDSTFSLRQDVSSGRTQRPADLALAGAITGVIGVPLVAATWLWGGGGASAIGGDASASTSSFGSSSSCSSSSCGGGGGCGSSSCGGGGGCGG